MRQDTHTETVQHDTDGAQMYEKTMTAGWGDMDFNSHMSNTALLNKAADIRLLYLAENGFPVGEFARLKLGPVLMKDEIDYQREVRLLEHVKVTLALAGHSNDGSRWLLRSEILRADGKLAARVASAGGWFDLAARKLIAPPDPLLAAMRSLPKADDFRDLPSSMA